MTYDAVIFDLFGTLVPSFGGEPYEACLREMAAAVGADAQAFGRLWLDHGIVSRRTTGGFDSQAACIEHICRLLGLSPSRDAVQSAVEARTRLVRASLAPRPDAVETLRRLREMGLRTGLMTVCSPEVPQLWDETPLAPLVDAALFSCSVGLDKPDPRFYALACERLGVAGNRCLYVGDGAGRELSGAVKAGMRAALICPPAEAAVIMKHADAREWRGPSVAALAEVIDLLAMRRSTKVEVTDRVEDQPTQGG